MIDYIKLTTGQRDVLENTLKSKTGMEFTCRVNDFTGELSYPYTSNLENIFVRLTDKSGIIENSIHKYYNSKKGKGNHNYNDFTYENFSNAINLLENDLQTELSDFKLVPMEFGLNITMSMPTSEILNKNVFLYNFEPFTIQRSYGKSGFMLKYEKTDFDIKLYNKGLQYNVSQNLLRLEVKIKRSRLLNKLGVYNIKDLLEKENLYSLFDFLINELDKLMIIDRIPHNHLTKDELSFINELKNKHFWSDLKEEKSSAWVNKSKKKFNEFIQYKNLNNIKEEMRYLLHEKFSELIQN